MYQQPATIKINNPTYLGQIRKKMNEQQKFKMQQRDPFKNERPNIRKPTEKNRSKTDTSYRKKAKNMLKSKPKVQGGNLEFSWLKVQKNG